uniref:RPAP1/MINIYO-like TPR repeats domain-containing protein n=1 Tax=Timema bartmani TaxID=61472 RepID=A0A7R9I3T2_9NEOP|nr:unnamed protein product [Timema bartmani]
MVSECHEIVFLPQLPPTQACFNALIGNNSSLETSRVAARKFHKVVPRCLLLCSGDLYPVLTRLLMFHLSVTSVSNVSSLFDHEHGTALICLIEQAVLTAHAQSTKLVNQQVNQLKQRIVHSLGREHVRGYQPLLETCAHKWLSQLATAEELTFSALKLVGATLSSLATYYSIFQTWPDTDVVSQIDQVVNLVDKYLLQFMQSPNYLKLMGNLRLSSCLLSHQTSGTKRDPEALPSLGALSWGGSEVVPVLGPSSPVPMLQGVLNLLIAGHLLHKNLSTQCVKLILGTPAMHEFLTSLIECSQPNLTNSWFTRYEIHLLSSILKLASLCHDYHTELFHTAALRLAILVQSQDRSMLVDLFSNIVFNPQFSRESMSLVPLVESLKLSENDGRETSVFPKHQLLTDALYRLDDLKSCYQEALGLSDAEEVSPLDVISLTFEEKGNEPALPGDWGFLPILALYSKEFSGRSPSARKRLHSVMEEMGLPVLELIQFVDTRWSSEYNMLSRLHAVRKAVGAELANSENNIEVLTAVEWKQAAGIVEVLGPLADATKEISGDSYPTSSMVIPILHCLKSHLNVFITSKKDGVMFARSLDKALKSRFSFYDSDPIFCPSMLCDPRFRGVLIDDMVAVNTLAIEVKKLSDKSSLEPNVRDEQPSCSSSSSGLWSSFDSIPNTTQPAIDNNSEVKEYLNEPRTHGGSREVQPASDAAILTVTRCLQWLFVLECMRPTAANFISVTARFCRLSTVFLAASDLFLDPVIHNYLDALLRHLMTKNSVLVFTEKIPGLSSFFDLYEVVLHICHPPLLTSSDRMKPRSRDCAVMINFIQAAAVTSLSSGTNVKYTQLVDQFEGVSYGDKLFGHFLLIPLQQRHSGEYRKLVWGEHTPILRLLPAKWGEPLFPYENLIEPREMDPTLLTCYLNALVSEKVQSARSPVLYHAAAEHVVSFIASQADTTLARQLTDRIVKLGSGTLLCLTVESVPCLFPPHLHRPRHPPSLLPGPLHSPCCPSLLSQSLVSFLRTCTGRATHPLYCLDRSTVHRPLRRIPSIHHQSRLKHNKNPSQGATQREERERVNQANYQQRYTHPPSRHAKPFQNDNLVLVRTHPLFNANEANYAGYTPKWEGPYPVNKQRGGIYLVTYPNGQARKKHRGQLHSAPPGENIRDRQLQERPTTEDPEPTTSEDTKRPDPPISSSTDGVFDFNLDYFRSRQTMMRSNNTVRGYHNPVCDPNLTVRGHKNQVRETNNTVRGYAKPVRGYAKPVRDVNNTLRGYHNRVRDANTPLRDANITVRGYTTPMSHPCASAQASVGDCCPSLLSQSLVSFLRTCTGRATHPLYCLDRSTVHVLKTFLFDLLSKQPNR